eukprot:114230_1
MSWSNGYISIEHEWLCLPFFVLYILGFIFIIELNRRFPVVEIFWFSVMPFVFTVLLLVWSENNTIFLWVKLYSVVFACWILQLIRYRLESWKEKNPKIFSVIVWILFFVLTINILEAVIAEFRLLVSFEQGIFIGNSINGMILLFTQANPISIVASPTRFRTVRYKLGWIWIIDYTLWNAIFVYNYVVFVYECHDIEHILFSIRSISVHLAVPLIMLIWTQKDEWIQYRAHALCLNLYSGMMNVEFLYHLPFYRIQRDECGENRNGALLITKLFSWISFMFGIVVLVKDIYDEIASWNGKEKAHDYSLIQWIISRFRAKKDIEQGNEMQNCIENSNNNNTSKMYDTVTNGVNVVEDNDTIHV